MRTITSLFIVALIQLMCSIGYAQQLPDAPQPQPRNTVTLPTNIPPSTAPNMQPPRVFDASFLRWNMPSWVATATDIVNTCRLLRKPGIVESGTIYGRNAGCSQVAGISAGTTIGITALSAIAKHYSPNTPEWKVLPVINTALRVTAVILSEVNTSHRHR